MEEFSIKVVGTRKARIRPTLKEINDFLTLCIKLRKTPHLVRRGVFRYETFEDAQEWMRKETLMTLTRSSRGRQQ
jgi:hypothetical protein